MQDRCARKARDVLDSRIAEKVTLPDLAGEAGMSPCHLQRLFSSHFGVSPQKYQLRRRVERGRRLLASTSRSVTEIAFDLGFSSAAHFAKTFRRLTGLSPTKYRKNVIASRAARRVK